MICLSEGSETCYVGKQRHPRIPSADLPNFRKLSLCLLQYLADYCHVPIRPGCNVSTTQNKMWHFSFLTGLHFLLVTFSVTPARDRSIWHLLQGVLSAGHPMAEPPSTSVHPVPEAVSTRAMGLKATHSLCPLVLQMYKLISLFNHLL